MIASGAGGRGGMVRVRSARTSNTVSETVEAVEKLALALVRRDDLAEVRPWTSGSRECAVERCMVVIIFHVRGGEALQTGPEGRPP